MIELIGGLGQALPAVGDFAPGLRQLLFEGFLAVAQVLDLNLLPPSEFELVRIGNRQIRPQLVEQGRGLFLQVLALGGQAGQIGLGLAVHAQVLVDGFDFGRTRNQALRHGQGREQSVEPGDFRHGIRLGLPDRFQP